MDKKRTSIPFLNSSCHDHAEVFGRSLVRVPDLGTSNLEDHGSHLTSHRGPENGPGTVVSHSAQIDGGHRKVGRSFLPSAGDIELMNRCRIDPQRLPQFPQDTAEDFLKEYYFRASEFFVFEDDTPRFDFYATNAISTSRVKFLGWRFRYKELAGGVRGKITIWVNSWPSTFSEK